MVYAVCSVLREEAEDVIAAVSDVLDSIADALDLASHPRDNSLKVLVAP